jgi:hypothetical protein
MRRSLSLSLLALAFAPALAEANPRSVGLGAAAGIALPHSGDVGYKPTLAWGFFVDIPLISTFSITPSAIVYGVHPDIEGVESGDPYTDISLSFKFVIPLDPVGIFLGLTAGLTTSTDLDVHVGGLAGVSIQIVANFEIFVQANYRVLIEEGNNRHTLHAFAGPLFRFN